MGARIDCIYNKTNSNVTIGTLAYSSPNYGVPQHSVVFNGNFCFMPNNALALTVLGNFNMLGYSDFYDIADNQFDIPISMTTSSNTTFAGVQLGVNNLFTSGDPHGLATALRNVTFHDNWLRMYFASGSAIFGASTYVTAVGVLVSNVYTDTSSFGIHRLKVTENIFELCANPNSGFRAHNNSAAVYANGVGNGWYNDNLVFNGSDGSEAIGSSGFAPSDTFNSGGLINDVGSVVGGTFRGLVSG
jgi:hypothetical protein